MRFIRRAVVLITLLFSLLGFVAIAAGGILFLYEIRTHRFESAWFSKTASNYAFYMDQGPSNHIRFPESGPLNERRGYTRLPSTISHLLTQGFRVKAQSRISPEMIEFMDKGFNALYDEKEQGGLTILDRRGKKLFSSIYPSPVYKSFDSIPPLVLQTILFIEDQNLMDTLNPIRNPAIDWPRFVGSMFHLAASKVGFGGGGNVAGASTIATQLEKFCYSPEGRTSEPTEKLRQMVSASMRAYQNGENTIEARKSTAVKYINNAPLGAFSGYGEVNGLGEGLRLWYEANFDSVNMALKNPSENLDLAGKYYRMVLSLFIAHRRPSFYLGTHPEALQKKTDTYLRVLNKEGYISDDLFRASSTIQITTRRPGQSKTVLYSTVKKSASIIRSPLLSLMSLPRLYDLDRMDATVTSSLDSTTLAGVENLYKKLRFTSFLDSNGLRGFRMLERGDPASLIYSFTLYERVGNRNLLRVQADSYDSPLNFNEGIKLDLGSTAKLRTMVTYLEIMEDLYNDYSRINKKQLSALSPARPDALSNWMKQYLLSKDTLPSLDAVLQAALQRPYSANPGERFFTGSGVHTFANFDHKYDHSVLPIKDAFRLSLNLPMVRLMRDIVYYYMYNAPGTNEYFHDTTGLVREKYLDRFVEYESRVFMSRFYSRLKKVDPQYMIDTLASGMRPTPRRLAAIYCTVQKDPTPEGLQLLIKKHGLSDTSIKEATELISQVNPSVMSLSDRGYITSIHPLKLWLASYMMNHPGAPFREAQQASIPELKDVYKWLYKTSRVAAQDKRIRTILEMEAFYSVHQSWQRLGYPFADLVPSYATALGTSADRPAALAELAGIIQNDGMRYPIHKVEKIHFAEDTPYETIVERDPTDEGLRVLSVPVARAARGCMYAVVQDGTASRAKNLFPDHPEIQIGGKTGTGDHRMKVVDSHGRRVEEKIMNRTATFMFIIGDRFFGTISAMVPGSDAKNFSFTSSYPVQLLKILAPLIEPLILEGQSQPVHPLIVQITR